MAKIIWYHPWLPRRGVTETDREPHLGQRAEIRRDSSIHVLLKFLGMAVSLVKHQMM